MGPAACLWLWGAVGGGTSPSLFSPALPLGGFTPQTGPPGLSHTSPHFGCARRAGCLCGSAPGPTRNCLALPCFSPAPWPWPGLAARLLRAHLPVCSGPGVAPQAGLELGLLSTLPVTLSAPLPHRDASPTTAPPAPPPWLLPPSVPGTQWAGLGSGLRAQLGAHGPSSSPESVWLLKAGSSPSGCQMGPGPGGARALETGGQGAFGEQSGF